jgi:hypothetical protein
MIVSMVVSFGIAWPGNADLKATTKLRQAAGPSASVKDAAA